MANPFEFKFSADYSDAIKGAEEYDALIESLYARTSDPIALKATVDAGGIDSFYGDLQKIASASDQAVTIKASVDAEDLTGEIDKALAKDGSEVKIKASVDGDVGGIEDAVAGAEGEAQDLNAVLLAMVGTLGRVADSMEEVRKEAKEVKEEVEDIGGVAKVMVAADFAGNLAEKFSAIAEEGTATTKAMEQLSSRTGATGAELDKLKDKADEAFRLGLGENVNEAIEKIGEVKQALGNAVRDEDLGRVTAYAGALGDAFGVEAQDAAGKSQTLITSFGLEAEKAFDLVALGAQKGRTSQDDFLDTISEYSPLLKTAGYSAEQFVGTLTYGAEQGLFNLDKVGDAIKETQIRLRAGDIDNALKDLQAPAALKTSIEKIVEQGKKGAISIKEVIEQVNAQTLKAVDAGQIGEQVQTQIQTAISGTPAEDIGAELYGRIFSAKIDDASIRSQAAIAGRVLKDNMAPRNLFERVEKEVSLFAGKAKTLFAPIAAGAAGALGTLSQFAPGIKLIGDNFGTISSVAKTAWTAIVSGATSVVPALGAQTVATGTATVAQTGLNLAALAFPAFLLIAGIAAVVAAFVIFGDSTKSLEDAISDSKESVEAYNEALKEVDAAEEAAVAVDDLRTRYAELQAQVDGGDTDPATLRALNDTGKQIAEQFPEAVEVMERFDETGKKIGETYKVNTEILKGFSDQQRADANQQLSDATNDAKGNTAALIDSLSAAQTKQTELRAEQEQILNMTDEEARSQGGIVSIIAGKAGQLREIGGEIREQNDLQKQGKAQLEENVQVLLKQGYSAQQIALEFGKTTEEINKLGVGTKQTAFEAEKLKQAMKINPDVGTAIGKLQSVRNTLVTLAERFKAANQQIPESLQKQLQAVNDRLADTYRRTDQLSTKFAADADAKAKKTAATPPKVTPPKVETPPPTVVKIDFTVDTEKLTREAGDIRSKLAVKATEGATSGILAEYTESLRLIERASDDKLKELQAKRDTTAGKNEVLKITGSYTAAFDALTAQTTAKTEELTAAILPKLRDAFFAANNEEVKASVDDLKRQLEAVTGTSVAALEQRRTLTRSILEAEQAEELETFVGSMGVVKDEADKILQRNVSSAGGKLTDAVIEASNTELQAYIARLKTSDEVLSNFITRQGVKRKAEEEKLAVEIERRAAERIRDEAERTNALALLDLRQRFAEQRGIYAEDKGALHELDLEEAAERRTLEEKNLEKTDDLFAISLAFREEAYGSYNANIINADRERLEEELKTMKEGRTEFIRGLDIQGLSYADYSAKINDYDQQIAEKRAELEASSFDLRVETGKAITAATGKIVERYSQEVKTTSTELTDFIKGGVATADEIQEKQFDLLEGYGKKAIATMGAALGGMIEAGKLSMKEFGKIILTNLIDLVEAEILAYTPTIYAAAAGLLGPIAGPIAATVILVGVEGGLALAKSAVSGFQEGTDEVPGNRLHRDSVLSWTDPGEAIIQRDVADRERGIIKWMRRGKDSRDYHKSALFEEFRQETAIVDLELRSVLSSLQSDVDDIKGVIRAIPIAIAEGVNKASRKIDYTERKDYKFKNVIRFERGALQSDSSQYHRHFNSIGS